MAARRYEIFLGVLKKYFTSERRERVKYFQHSKKKEVLSCGRRDLLYKNQ